MKVTKENYEAYLLDLWEGTLSAEGRELLEEFFAEHPELKEEVEFGELPIVENEEHRFRDKQKLKRQEEELTSLEYLLIGNAEGVLTQEEENILVKELNNKPSLEKEIACYSALKLEATTIPFPDKETLKKREAIPFVVWRYAAAAVLLFGIGFWLFLSNKSVDPVVVKDEPIRQHPVVKKVVKEEPKNLVVEIQASEKPVSEKKKSDKVFVKEINKAVVKNPSLPNPKPDIIKPLRENVKDVHPRDVIVEHKKKELDEKQLPMVSENQELSQKAIAQVESTPKEAPTLAGLVKQKVEEEVFHKEVNKQNNTVRYSFRVGKFGFSRKRTARL